MTGQTLDSLSGGTFGEGGKEQSAGVRVNWVELDETNYEERNDDSLAVYVETPTLTAA